MRRPAKKLDNRAAERLASDGAIGIRAETTGIAIEAAVEHEADLDSLLAAITDDNLRELIDFGGPFGREAW